MKILQTQKEREGRKIICHLISDVLLGSVLKDIIVSGCVQTDQLSSHYKVMTIEFPAEPLKGWCNSSWLAGNFIELVTGGSQVTLGDFLVCNVGAVSSEYTECCLL